MRYQCVSQRAQDSEVATADPQYSANQLSLLSACMLTMVTSRKPLTTAKCVLTIKQKKMLYSMCIHCIIMLKVVPDNDITPIN